MTYKMVNSHSQSIPIHCQQLFYSVWHGVIHKLFGLSAIVCCFPGALAFLFQLLMVPFPMAKGTMPMVCSAVSIWVPSFASPSAKLSCCPECSECPRSHTRIVLFDFSSLTSACIQFQTMDDSVQILASPSIMQHVCYAALLSDVDAIPASLFRY